MKRPLTITLLLIALFSGVAFAKDWRGITPLRSTRADVESILGKPAASEEYAAYYELPQVLVVINYKASGGCDSFGLGWNVPPGRVTAIGIIPKTKVTKEAAGVTDGFKVEKENYGDFAYYENDKEGLSIETYFGAVTNIRYGPTSDDETLRCPRVQDCCYDFFPEVYAYTESSKAVAHGGYHILFFHMNRQFGRGAVVVLGRNAAERKLRMAREAKYLKFFANFYHIPISRVLIIDGGYNPKPLTKMQVHPISGGYNRIYINRQPDPEDVPKKR